MAHQVSGVASINEIMRSTIQGETRLQWLSYLKLTANGLEASEQQVLDYVHSQHDLTIRRVILATGEIQYQQFGADNQLRIIAVISGGGGIYNESRLSMDKELTTQELAELKSKTEYVAYEGAMATIYIPKDEVSEITHTISEYKSGFVLLNKVVLRKEII